MPAETKVPNKLFFKIGEVCEITDTQPYVLRYWESEFPALAPAKNSSGQRIYRHLQGNLRDEELAKDDRVLRHLAAKGAIAAMTKAASYLLTWSEFGRARDYLLEHATWIVSDATGPLPSDARRAGFTYETYGEVGGPRVDRAGEGD
jgi:hypothetical protein